MEVERDKMHVTVAYRGKQYTAEVPVDATVGLLGKQLSQLTGVALETMRLLVPKGRRMAASALHPASEPHSSSTLERAGITPVPTSPFSHLHILGEFHWQLGFGNHLHHGCRFYGVWVDFVEFWLISWSFWSFVTGYCLENDGSLFRGVEGSDATCKGSPSPRV